MKDQPLPDTYWLSRDRHDGELADIEVWAVKPERHAYPDGNVMWEPPSEVVDVSDCVIDEWTVAEARKIVGNGIPDGDSELLVVGRS